MKQCFDGKLYFYGVEITEEELKKDRINYSTLARTLGPMILCNDIVRLFEKYDYELLNGSDYDEEEDEYYDFYQFYLIDGRGVDILREYTDETIFYIEELDLAIWGIDHFGTPWEGVNTSIKISEL